MIHWHWIVFSVVVILLLVGIFKESNVRTGDYGFNLMAPFLIIILIAFILIWGGIFWW